MVREQKGRLNVGEDRTRMGVWVQAMGQGGGINENKV